MQFDAWRPESTPEFIEQQQQYVNLNQIKQFQILQFIHAICCRRADAQIKALLVKVNPKFNKVVSQQSGFVQKRHNQDADEVFSVNMDLYLNAISERDSCTQIVGLERANDAVRFISIDHQSMSTNALIKLINNKRVDVVCYIDNCSFRKDANTVNICPKLRIHQLIVRDYIKPLQKQMCIGLPIVAE